LVEKCKSWSTKSNVYEFKYSIIFIYSSTVARSLFQLITVQLGRRCRLLFEKINWQMRQIMETYKGSCHCGSVVFEIEAYIQEFLECNCSICIKKGMFHLPVEDKNFKILKGKKNLSLYQFGTNQASHWFCKNCGIHPFGRPRTNPNRYTINLRCLERYDYIIKNISQKVFNGRDHPLDRSP